jgi:hypothetical protein
MHRCGRMQACGHMDNERPRKGAVALRRREPWHAVARGLRSELVAERGNASGGFWDRRSPPAIAAAARRTGYSINLLTRFLAVLDWAERIAETGEVSVEDIEAASFASIEVVRRIWQLDADLGRELLRQAIAGQIGSRRLRKILNTLSTSEAHRPRQRRASGAADRRLRILMAHEILRAGVKELSGSPSLRWVEADQSIWRTAPYAHFDGMAVKVGPNDKVEWVDGFDLREFGGRSINDEMIDALGRAAISATYFRRFFLVIIEPGADRLDWLTKAARDLKLRQFGIAAIEFEPKQRVVVALRPAESAMPDRRREVISGLAQRRPMSAGG